MPPSVTAAAAPAPTPVLRRTLGLWPVTLSGIGVILGAGVYALVGPAAARAGGALWLAFLMAGAAAGLTAYSYARLGAMRPKDSPEFQYTALAFGPHVGFVAGWLMLAADLLAVATVALGFGGYLEHLVGLPTVPGALGLLAVAGLIVAAGVGESVALAIVLTVVEAAGLLFVVAIGLPFWTTVDYLEMPHGLAGVSGAASLIFFAYLGFDELGNFAEEMRRPERDLPRALAVAMAASTAIYLAVALSAVGAVGWRELAASSAPLARVAGTVLGARADTTLSVVALAATGNTVLLLLVAGSRSVYGMAAAGVLPAALGRVGRSATPLTATVVVSGVAAALVFAGDLARVAALTDAAVLGSFVLVNLALPWLVVRGLAPGRGIRRGADLAVPSLAVLLCGWLLLHAGWLALGTAAALAAIGLGVAGRRSAVR
jgi:APA family basic amino acid/polyamine antiporter